MTLLLKIVARFHYLLILCAVIFICLSLKVLQYGSSRVLRRNHNTERIIRNANHTRIIHKRPTVSPFSGKVIEETIGFRRMKIKKILPVNENLALDYTNISREIAVGGNSQTKVERIFLPKAQIGASLISPTLVKKVDINPQILQFVQIKENETKDTFVNLHSYEFHLNSHACKFGKIFLVMVIHSAPDYFQKRARIRSTFGSVTQHLQRKIARVFMIGSVRNKTIQEQLEEEAKTYGDIVQGNFLDTYRNLSKKHIMGMHWYKHNCKAEYILKLDDDTFVNPYRLIEHILKTKRTEEKMWCRIAKNYHPFRDPKSKYHTPKEEFPFVTFPNFCLGFAYLTTPAVWDGLYQMSETTRIMSMDDVFVGILSMRINVETTDFTDILLPCKSVNHMNLMEINKKPLVFDPFSLCGNLPFRNWRRVKP